MELPNYSRQLMQQLHTLRKEGQFCDCTIVVGDELHRAHKLVLAASSLLFKSVLEGSDSISIDPDVVTSQEFSSLLEMVYTGKLPPGKHNLTRVITAADSLQMFDVAVSCKNILTSLMKPLPGQPPVKDAQGPGPSNRMSDQDTAMSSSDNELSQDNPTGAVEDSDIAHGKSGGRGFADDSSVDTAILDQLGDRSTAQDLLSGPEPPSCEKAQQESTENSDKRDLKLLSQLIGRGSELVCDIQPWLKVVETWESISSEERQVILDCCKEDPEGSIFLGKLLNKLTEGKVLSLNNVLALLDLFKEANPDLAALLQKLTENERRDSMGSEVSVADEAVGEMPRSGVLLDRAAELIEILSGISSLSDSLTTAAQACLEEQERMVGE